MKNDSIFRILACIAPLLLSPLWAKEKNAQQKIADLGGRLFHKKGEVVEVVLNGTSFKSGELKFLTDFPHLTDLSLEKTSARDQDMAIVAKLPKLEWLNLYRTDHVQLILSITRASASLRCRRNIYFKITEHLSG